jgi:inner membrane protein
VLSYPDGTFIPLAVATHGLVGLTLGAVLFGRPWTGLVGGLFADGDFLFPGALGPAFVHRSFTHSALVLGVATGVAVAVASRGPTRRATQTGGTLAVAYLSHLLIDTTTPQGVQWLWPLVTEKIHVDLVIGGHAPIVTLSFWVVCLGLLLVWGRDGAPMREWG